MIKRRQDQPWWQRQAGLFLLLGVGLFGLMIVASLVNTFFLTPHTVVMVEFDEQRCTIDGDFELMWIHSVEKQWWVEAYAVEGEQLLLTDTYFETFGAGTPSTEKLAKPSDKYPDYVHYQINTYLPYLNWMISSNIKARLIVNPHSEHPLILPIYQWVDDYTNVHISSSTQNLWKLRRQESCHDYSKTANTANVGDTTTERSSTTF